MKLIVFDGGCNMEKMEKVPMASFTAPRMLKLIARKEIVGTDGEIDYNKLMRKVDEYGERLFKEARLFQRT